MTNFSTITFTHEESAEIARLEKSQPDQALYLKTLIALERLGFIISENEKDGPDETPITQPLFILTNREGRKLLDLFGDWSKSEYNDEVGEDMPGTFIRLTNPDFANVTITFRKQSELATNKFSFHII